MARTFGVFRGEPCVLERGNCSGTRLFLHEVKANVIKGSSWLWRNTLCPSGAFPNLFHPHPPSSQLGAAPFPAMSAVFSCMVFRKTCLSFLNIKLCLVISSTKLPHSSTSAWQIPWAEEPGRLQSMGSWRVRHDWVTSLSLFTFMHWRRKLQPTPVFLPGESQGRGSLVGCRLWGRTESDTTEAT